MKNKLFVIKDHIGFVSGFDSQHLCVVSVEDSAQAKTFKTAAAARKYANKYAGAGFGLGKDFQIVSI